MVGDQIYADMFNRMVPLGLADTYEEFQLFYDFSCAGYPFFVLDTRKRDEELNTNPERLKLAKW